MFRTAVGIVLSVAFSASVWSQNCTDIRRFDFKNATIHVGKSDANELGALYNAPRGIALAFHLRDGVALTYDGSPPISNTPDWRAELVADREVHPEASIWIRVISLEDVHMTGTGTWIYVLGFGCERGHLIREFQFSSEGTMLKHLDNQSLQILQGIWSPTDAHADPSRRRELTFKWDAQVHRYRLATIRPGDSAKPPQNDK
jgi:hypothetical protein